MNQSPDQRTDTRGLDGPPDGRPRSATRMRRDLANEVCAQYGIGPSNCGSMAYPNGK
jgi:hypothetical protein